MIAIRPISDLRNNFTEIEAVVNDGRPVYLTKNGRGSMVVLSLEQYSALIDGEEAKLDEMDRIAENDQRRLTAEEIFGKARERVNSRNTF